MAYYLSLARVGRDHFGVAISIILSLTPAMSFTAYKRVYMDAVAFVSLAIPEVQGAVLFYPHERCKSSTICPCLPR